jgi:hypothetical protein
VGRFGFGSGAIGRQALAVAVRHVRTEILRRSTAYFHLQKVMFLQIPWSLVATATR